MKKTLFMDVVNEKDEVIGRTTWEEMQKKKLRVRCSAVLVFNSKKQIFVHKRSMNLPTHPGKHDIKLGGLVDAGESYEQAATREIEEEAGIKNVELEFLTKHSTDAVNRKIFRIFYDGPMKLDPSRSGKWRIHQHRKSNGDERTRKAFRTCN